MGTIAINVMTTEEIETALVKEVCKPIRAIELSEEFYNRHIEKAVSRWSIVFEENTEKLFASYQYVTKAGKEKTGFHTGIETKDAKLTENQRIAVRNFFAVKRQLQSLVATGSKVGTIKPEYDAIKRADSILKECEIHSDLMEELIKRLCTEKTKIRKAKGSQE